MSNGTLLIRFLIIVLQVSLRASLTALPGNPVLVDLGVQMASFTDLIAQRIYAQRNELLASLSINPNDDIEHELATGVQTHWHPFVSDNTRSKEQSQLRVG